MLSDLQKQKLIQELSFSATRSSGPGGQHVNKVSSKIELRFNLFDSNVLNDIQKNSIQTKLANKLTNEFELIITVQTSRSQLKNKAEAIQKFIFLIDKTLTPQKKRKRTKPTLTSKKKRIENKIKHSIKKNLRKRPEL